jgi:hypothetical protein
MAGRVSTRSRFAVAYLVLGAALGTTLGTLIVLLQRPSPTPPPPFSSWRPTASEVQERIVQIANHVGRTYRLPSGNQLTQVKIGGPAAGKSLRAIIIPTTPNPQTLDDFERFDGDKSVVYVLCGSGTNCKIAEGAASTARGTVIRREALELALYTMAYAKPIDNVLVFVPPGPGEKKLNKTLFFHRDDLSSTLDRPLRMTLPHRPPLPGAIKPAEKRTVDELTGNLLYQYVNFVPINGYGNVLAIQR